MPEDIEVTKNNGTFARVADAAPVMTPELQAALEKFQEKFAERSFSQRHTELGKMINCPKCGLRHRQGDPLLKDSTAHGAQKEATFEYPSRAAVTKGKRVLPHHSARLLQLVVRTREIFHNDIEPYFHLDPEHPERLMLRARRMAIIQLGRLYGWTKYGYQNVARKRMQDVSHRINRGLIPGGSR